MSRRAGAAALTSFALLACGALPAFADPTPAPAPTTIPTTPATPTTSATPDAGANRIEDVLARQQRLTAELQAAQARLDAAEAEAGLAVEAFNKARAEQKAAESALAAAKKAAAEAKAASTHATGRLNQLAATMHMRGPELTGWHFLLGVASPEKLIRSASGLEVVADYRDRDAAQAAAAAAKADAAQSAAARAELQARQATAAADRARVKAQAAADAIEAEATAIATRQNALLAELAGLRRTSVEAEVERLILAGETAERARVLAEKTYAAPDLPAPDRDAAATAIEFAKAQLGEPYLWGGEGPDAWDCSGLTMKAWAAAGHRLTHYTGSQWQETKRVAIADLAPGDLVFFGKTADSIHHVGLYVGNGQMIEAPRTGLNVRYASIYRSSLLPYGGRVG